MYRFGRLLSYLEQNLLSNCLFLSVRHCHPPAIIVILLSSKIAIAILASLDGYLVIYRMPPS